jgi:hypothetical protein
MGGNTTSFKNIFSGNSLRSANNTDAEEFIMTHNKRSAVISVNHENVPHQIYQIIHEKYMDKLKFICSSHLFMNIPKNVI